tara:strand:+ start:2362 stop:2973 length:612 start_codon:yes stop_codon:yes gene_type:complete
MQHSLLFFFGLGLLVFLSSTNLLVNLLILIFFFTISIIFNLPILSVIRKIKYFIIALLLIYTLSTPGEIIFYYSIVSATNEGLFLGINNSLRIINTFLTIMLLMKFIPKKFFINFIIKIFYPLKFAGLNMDNFTSRIYLTFDYLEFYKNFSFKFSDFTKVINSQINNESPIIKVKVLPRVTPSFKDYCWVISFFSIFILIQVF